MDAQKSEPEEPPSREVAFGLNATGVAMLVVLTLLCAPFLWLPFIFPACRASELWTRDGTVTVRRGVVALESRVRRRLAAALGCGVASNLLFLAVMPAYRTSELLVYACLAGISGFGITGFALALRLRRVDAPWLLAAAMLMSWGAVLPVFAVVWWVTEELPRYLRG